MSTSGPTLPAGPSGLARYAQLAHVLRHRIGNGHWQAGERLPTVQQLAAELGVARITVRQAYAQLAAEGLMTTRRGRGTHVATTANDRPSAALRAAINDQLQQPSGLRIEILSTRRDLALPDNLAGGLPVDASYVQLRKLHRHDGTPFCLIELYVAQAEYDRFPVGAVEHGKVAGLLRRHATRPLDTLHQTLVISPAEQEQADCLDYPFASALARVTRRLTDADGRIVYAGIFWYRGDLLVLDTTLPAEFMFRYPLAVVPAILREP